MWWQTQALKQKTPYQKYVGKVSIEKMQRRLSNQERKGGVWVMRASRRQHLMVHMWTWGLFCIGDVVGTTRWRILKRLIRTTHRERKRKTILCVVSFWCVCLCDVDINPITMHPCNVMCVHAKTKPQLSKYGVVMGGKGSDDVVDDDDDVCSWFDIAYVHHTNTTQNKKT